MSTTRMAPRGTNRRVFFKWVWWDAAAWLGFALLLPSCALVALGVFFGIGGSVSRPALGIVLVSGVATPFVWWRLWVLFQSRHPLLALYREGLLFQNPTRATLKELPDALPSGKATRVRAITLTQGRATWDQSLRVWVAGVPLARTLNFEFESEAGYSEAAQGPQRVRITVSYDDQFLVPLRQIDNTIARFRGHEAHRQALPSWSDPAALEADALSPRFRLRIRTLMLLVLAVACYAAVLRGCVLSSEGIR